VGLRTTASPPLGQRARTRNGPASAFYWLLLAVGLTALQLPLLLWPQWLLVELGGAVLLAFLLALPTGAHRSGASLALCLASAQVGLSESGASVGVLKFAPLVLAVTLHLIGNPAVAPLHGAFRRALLPLGCFLFWALAFAWESYDPLTLALRVVSLGLLFALAFWLVPRSLQAPRDWEILASWLLIALIPTTLATAFGSGGEVRSSGTLTNANSAAWVSATAGALAVSQAAGARSTWGRALGLAVLVLAGVAILQTGSRAGTLLLGVTLSLGYLVALAALSHRRIPRSPAQRFGSLALAVSVLGATALTFATGGEKEHRALDFGASGGLNTRDEIWQTTVATTMRVSPLTGRGYGVGGHSAYVGIFNGTGVVGSLLFLWFLVSVLSRIGSHIASRRTSPASAYLAAFIPAYMLGCAFEDGLTSAAFPPAVVAWAVMGLLVSRPDLARLTPLDRAKASAREGPRQGASRV
jgi:hypothetical protein